MERLRKKILEILLYLYIIYLKKVINLILSMIVPSKFHFSTNL